MKKTELLQTPIPVHGILRGQDVYFKREKLPMKAMAISERYVVVSRPLDAKIDKSLLMHEVKMGAYCDFEEALAACKDYPIYKILDFKGEKMGPHNRIFNDYDFTSIDDCQRCIGDLISEDIELSQRNSVSLCINEAKTIGATIDLVYSLINSRRKEFSLPDFKPFINLSKTMIQNILCAEVNDPKNEFPTETTWCRTDGAALEMLKPIMHEEWNEAYEEERFKETCSNADNGVTFAFYWKEGKLCWES